MDLLPVPPLWAVHISDGVLSWPWLAAGFALAGALALMGSYRLRDEEVPRLALLTAAFFVASSLHLKLGPSSVHLLLNGLVGVVLGRRAPLAILLGVGLQAALLAHGGFSTVGVNAATEALPALLAGWLFALLHGSDCVRRGWVRSLLVSVSALIWGGSLVFGGVVLLTNPVRELLAPSAGAGLVLSAANLGPAGRLLFHPVTLAALGAFAGGVAWGERRLGNAPEFALGLLVGVVAVLSTTALTGLVLLADGAEKWQLFVAVVFAAHLPLAALEGLVLGCVVGFLARVKPDLLGAIEASERWGPPTGVAAGGRITPARPDGIAKGRPAAASIEPPALLLALGALLLTAGPARAHRLEAVYSVDATRKRVLIESYYETNDVPQKATVKVSRTDGSVLAEGPLDGKGEFTFEYQEAGPLKVEVSAPGGHRKEFRIAAKELEAAPREAAPAAPVEKPEGSRGKDVLIGVGFLLAAAAFVLSVRNARELGRLRRGEAPTPAPVHPPTHGPPRPVSASGANADALP